MKFYDLWRLCHPHIYPAPSQWSQALATEVVILVNSPHVLLFLAIDICITAVLDILLTFDFLLKSSQPATGLFFRC